MIENPSDWDNDETDDPAFWEDEEPELRVLIECWKCDGDGKVREGYGADEFSYPCPECGGSGWR